VLVQPEWTQPTLSQAEIRANNGIPPPSVPIVPNAFTIQLYNPDQQVQVKQIAGSWNSSAYWEFEMPQQTFRLPSVSALDRSQSDPAASDTTPKVAFKWKRDGKLSRDITCFLSGKSTDGKRNKEPDITIAMFKHGKELTVYEPNMNRVEVEDTKGLEVVILLGSTVIKDIFFNANREMFNIGNPPASAARKNSGPIITGVKVTPPPAVSSGAVGGGLPGPPPRSHTNVSSSQPRPPQPPRPQADSAPSAHSPPNKSHTQWEIDAETARLRALVEAEEKERERADRHEQRRIKKMLEAEDREQKRRDAEIAKETERLRKQYGVDPVRQPKVHFTPPMPPRPLNNGKPVSTSRPQASGQFSQYHSAPHTRPDPTPRPQSTPGHNSNPSANIQDGPFHSNTLNSWWAGPSTSPPALAPNVRPGRVNGPYLETPGNVNGSSSGFFGLGGKKVQKKRSVFF
jgi:hypothetical protein